jgi:two-component system sensor histidine kinase KdpD
MAFHQKVHQLLMEVLDCMEATRGSIMLLKGKKTLEIVASTNPDLVGTKQTLDETSPSGWVVKEKRPLYVDKNTGGAALRSKMGTYQKSAFLIVPILRSGKVIGVLSVTDKLGNDIFEKEEQEILIQITTQVISALEMERLASSLNSSKKTLATKNKQLKKLEKLRTDLFNMLIHDLKGPLAEVVANLDILSYTIDDENRPFVETAQTGCESLESMVSNLLDIARMEERKLNLLLEWINPSELTKEALGRIFRLAKMKNIEFVEEPSFSETPVHLQGDRGLLQRVLQNLLTNAIQYSPADKPVTVGYSYLGTSNIRFFVKDEGPGVPPESRKAIFDKFMQLERKADGRIYTTGLGLTFCKMAITAHGGKIGVEDNKPQGSLFWFTLPLEKPDSQ